MVMHITQEPSNSQTILNLDGFSKSSHLHRVTAWVLSFMTNCRRTETREGPLTATEIQKAENYWIGQVQQAAFLDGIRCLRDGRPLQKASKIRNVRPFLDEDNILRVGGRMSASPQSFAESHPIVIPADTHHATLLLIDSHRQMLHSGVRDTIVQVRERFWILRARQQVKRIIQWCTICKKTDARRGTQVDGQLPADWVTMCHPFQAVGVDFASPLTLKRRARAYQKAYIILFTCAVTRAIHLELSEDMSAHKFIQAFCRFIACRGMCHTVCSDNAKTFKIVATHLRAISNAIQDPSV